MTTPTPGNPDRCNIPERMPDNQADTADPWPTPARELSMVDAGVLELVRQLPPAGQRLTADQAARWLQDMQMNIDLGYVDIRQ